jgi:hypothetical protein
VNLRAANFVGAAALIAGCFALAASEVLPLTAQAGIAGLTSAEPAATITPDTTPPTTTPPTTTPTRPSPTDMPPPTAEQYYSARWAEIQRDVSQFAQPSVNAVKVVADREWLRTVLECVSTYGLASRAVNAYRISELICEQQYPSLTGLEFASSVASRARLYDFYENTLRPCLVLSGQRTLDTPAYRTAMQPEPFFWRVNPPLSLDSIVHFRMQRCPDPVLPST